MLALRTVALEVLDVVMVVMAAVMFL